jgi:hypothetical protein
MAWLARRRAARSSSGWSGSLLALEVNASYAIIGLVIWLPCYLIGKTLTKPAGN